MISLPIISIVLCFSYVVFIVFKYGVPVSISETYYLLPTKWDWLFTAWSVLTSVPFGIYWFNVAPHELKWIPICVMVALLLVGAACCYKSGPKQGDDYEPNIVSGEPESVDTILYVSGSALYDSNRNKEEKWWKKLVEYLKTKFNPKTFFKYPARSIHYINSLIAIILSTIYICMTCGAYAIASTVIFYVVFIIIGMKVDGVYNKDYSLDVNNKAWIFFMEMICLINLFVFIW